MKHEIEIPDLPEGYEIGKPKVVYAHMGDSHPIYISIPLKKKQPHRIVLEETGEIRKPKAGEYIQNNGNYCLCRKPDRWGNEHEIWQAVEDNKCAE